MSLPRRSLVALLALLALALAVALAPAIASAQRAPSDADDQQARRLFEIGRTAVENSQYEDALGYFRRAYALSHRPALLYNIGQAADRLRRDDEALAAFEQYLREVPDTPYRVDVEARIATMRAGGTSAERAGEGGSAVPWIVIAGSGAVAVAGGVLLGLAIADKSSVEDAPDGAAWGDVSGASDRVAPLSIAGVAMLGVGVAGAALGVVLLVGSEDDDAPAVALGLAPGGVTLRGAF